MIKLIKPKLRQTIKRILFVAIIIFLFTFLQIYWAMGTLAENVSSGCLDCSFFDDTFMLSSINGFFLSFLFMILHSIKNKYLKIVIEFMLVISTWLFWNYSIFVDRKSSWSTYLFNEEIQYTISLSFLPVLVLSFIAFFIINYRLFIKKNDLEMKNLIPILILAFALQSCDNKTQRNGNEITTKSTIKNSIRDSVALEHRDTLNIKYSEHKNLLDILTKLPVSAMDSWKWSEKERIEFVEFIKENGFAFSSSSHFSKFSLIGPNTIGIQVVDGYWILAIYKVQTNNYIVITDDQNGDGNDLSTFEYKDGKLDDVGFYNLFDEVYYNNLLISNNDECKDLIEDNLIGFEYDFTHPTNLTISNTHYLKEDEQKKCLKGNTMNYKFNPTSKKFDLISIFWAKSKE